MAISQWELIPIDRKLLSQAYRYCSLAQLANSCLCRPCTHPKVYAPQGKSHPQKRSGQWGSWSVITSAICWSLVRYWFLHQARNRSMGLRWWDCQLEAAFLWPLPRQQIQQWLARYLWLNKERWSFEWDFLSSSLLMHLLNQGKVKQISILAIFEMVKSFHGPAEEH